MVIWVTGLSGAGKTTLCRALAQLLKPHVPELVLLDGDTVREAFEDDLGYAEPDRVVQIRRVQRLARVLADQRLVVLVAALYAHPSLLEWNRQHLPGYVEVYLKASMDTLRRRDSKDLYRRALAGEIAHVVGVDIVWHEPQAPDLVLDADRPSAPEEWARQVLMGVPRLAGLREEHPA